MFRGSTPSPQKKFLCCVCAAELGWAPGTEGNPDNQEEIQKHISPDEQLFPSPAGLGICLQPPQAQHRGTESFNQSELGRCSEVTGAESLPALDTGSLWLQDNAAAAPAVIS